VSIDLKPALTAEELRTRLQRDFDTYGKRGFRSLLAGLLPHKMIEPFVTMTGISPETPGHQIDAGDASGSWPSSSRSGSTSKVRFPLLGDRHRRRGLAQGGRSPDNGLPSRPGLFFCGEVLDLDADTGGYNLQAAFSTGYVAARRRHGCFLMIPEYLLVSRRKEMTDHACSP